MSEANQVSPDQRLVFSKTVHFGMPGAPGAEYVQISMDRVSKRLHMSFGLRRGEVVMTPSQAETLAGLLKAGASIARRAQNGE